MANTLSDWIKAFSDCEVPVLYQSKLKLQTLQKNELDITVTVLAEIARQDPGFSITLLRLASKSKKREITTLSHAISLISIPLVIKMLSESAVLEKTLDKQFLSQMLNEYSRQYFTAYIAREWSKLRHESENQEIYTAALNRGFVRYFLYLIDPEKAIKLEQIYLTPNDEHKTKEEELLGNNVDDIAQAVSKFWSLPELIRENYSGKHHNPKITGIRLVADLLRQIYSHSSIQYPEDFVKRIAEYIRIPVEQTPGKINSIIIKAIRESEKHIQYHHLLHMMMIYPDTIKTEQPKIKSNIEQQKNSVFSNAIELLRSKDTNKSARELIEITLNALKNGLEFSRVAFIPYDKKEKCLNVRFQFVDKKLASLTPLKISIESNKLFNQLLKKEQTLGITKKNQRKFSHLLPEKLRPIKPDATIIINSFYANNKVIGCFFADHGNTDKNLTANDIKLFKVICTELKTAIESNLQKKNTVKKAA